MASATTTRVPDNTAADFNDQIRRRTEENIGACSAAGPEAIRRRLAELDREWDIERIIEVEAPLTILAGLALTGAVGRKWLALPIFASSMLLLHSLHGWYPLIPILRRLGIRTQREISLERYALKALRGDFGVLGQDGEMRPHQAFEAAEASSG